MARLDVDVWAEGEVIKAFEFSDGYRHTGDDAASKLHSHFVAKSESMTLGEMRIHPWKPIGIHMN